MRVIARVLDENHRTGTKNGKPWSMFSVRVLETGGDKRGRMKDPLKVSLVDRDHDLAGSLEGQEIELDLFGVQHSERFGIEFRGAVVRADAVAEGQANGLSTVAA